MNALPNDLPVAAQLYRTALPPGKLYCFSLAALDLTGVPVWKVVLLLDEPHQAPMLSGCGYGMTDGEAITSALGELVEMTFAYLGGARLEQTRGNYAALAASHGANHIIDPVSLCLPAGSSVDGDTPLAWAVATRVATGEPVLVPVDVALSHSSGLPFGYRPFTTLIQHGLGAGPDFDWALSHGLFELLQRDGNGLVFRALDQGVVLDVDDSDLDPDTAQLLAKLDTLGIEVLPKFATDEFGFTNLYVVGAERDGVEPPYPIMLSACGEACDPDPRRALRKALLEYCSSRVRKVFNNGPLEAVARVAPQEYLDLAIDSVSATLAGEEARAANAMRDWWQLSTGALRDRLKPVFAEYSRKPFSSLRDNAVCHTRDCGAIASERLQAAGLDVLAVDFSPPGGSVSVVRAVVPGLEVETMSYHRIGERNARKLIDYGIPLIAFGEATETRKPVRLAPEAIERLGGQTPLLDTAAVDWAVGSLYPLYREPDMHVVPLWDRSDPPTNVAEAVA